MSLPKELLVARVERGRVLPGFALLTEANREVAKGLIQTFRESVGRKRRALEERLDAREPAGMTASVLRFRKGLVFLLLRRCRLVVESAVEPALARRRLFGAAGGPVADPERRAALLASVASELGVSPGSLEEALWADLEPEMVLREFDAPEPDELLREFNRALVHTLLGAAREVAVAADPEFVLARARALGLDARPEGRVVRLRMPAKAEALSRLFDDVASAPRWSVSASVLLPKKSGGPGAGGTPARCCEMVLDSSLAPLLVEAPAPPTPAPGPELLARLRPEGDVVALRSLAAEHGVEPEPLRSLLRGGVDGYLLAGDCLVKRSFAESLRRTLPREGRFEEMCRRVEEAGVPSAAALLEALGYRVRWSGLDPSKARAVAQEGD